LAPASFFVDRQACLFYFYMRNYLYILGIVLLAFFTILAVFELGDIPNRHNNGFKRSYFPKALSGARTLRLRDTLSEIVGSTQTTIFVSTATEGEILAIGKGLDSKVKRMKIPFFARYYDSLQFGSLSIEVDSPRIYLFAENKPAIVKTGFDSALFEIRILPPGAFTREAMVDTDCFILRKYESKLTDQIFVRYDFGTGQLKKENGISQIYGDGGMITDGRLHVDLDKKSVYFMYYYRNLLLAFDTSLRSVRKFSSRDTVRAFQMKTGLVGNGPAAAYTNITPANIINKANDVQGGLLYNMSTLKADNESAAFFSDHSVIDVIDLKNGRYLGSINIPIFDGRKIAQFIISDNMLIALYTNSIVIYGLELAIEHRDQ
jgi:hypothetical protein